MDRTILNDVRRMRNIDGTIIGEKFDTKRVEVPREIIEDLILMVDTISFKDQGIDEAVQLRFKRELTELLNTNGYNMRVR